MEYSRSELMPGVFLSHLKSDKFKTACMSLNLITQLSRETASINALLPNVLRRGTTRYPDMDMVSVGPQMYDVHSPKERLSISSTAKTWQWLKATLAAL